jgi:hypothetical protein
VYEKQKQWERWEDFLGTGFLPFEEAKKFVNSLGKSPTTKKEEMSIAVCWDVRMPGSIIACLLSVKALAAGQGMCLRYYRYY